MMSWPEALFYSVLAVCATVGLVRYSKALSEWM